MTTSPLMASKIHLNGALVEGETFVNYTARWLHSRIHKGGKAWYCESDRKFAEDILVAIGDWGWAIVEDDRSS